LLSDTAFSKSSLTFNLKMQIVIALLSAAIFVYVNNAVNRSRMKAQFWLVEFPRNYNKAIITFLYRSVNTCFIDHENISTSDIVLCLYTFTGTITHVLTSPEGYNCIAFNFSCKHLGYTYGSNRYKKVIIALL
jgi:hypothetical protein